MANMLRAVVTADVRRFERGMARVSRASARTAKVSKEQFAELQNRLDATAVTASLATIAITTAFAFATRSVIKFNKEAINAAKSYETLRLRLQLLSGDMRKGAKEFDYLREFAENSSFATDKVIDGYIRLRAVAGQGFAAKNIENIAFASRVAGESIETMSKRVGDLVLRLKTGLTGGLLARSLRTFGTAFGEEATIEMVKMAQAGEDASLILAKVEKALARIGVVAKKEFAGTAEGLEMQLGGAVKGFYAELGKGGLEEYKETLAELNKILISIRDTEAFKEMAQSSKLLNESISELVKSDDFKTFLEDALRLASVLTNALGAIVEALRWINRIPKVEDIISSVGGSVLNSFGIGNVSSEVSRTNAGSNQEKILKDIAETNRVSANALDPQAVGAQ